MLTRVLIRLKRTRLQSLVLIILFVDFRVHKEVHSHPSGRGRGGHLSTRGRGRGGIASIIGQLGKKSKLSTLEKSKLDWNNFKKKEGIEEDLERHNKGKEG